MSSCLKEPQEDAKTGAGEREEVLRVFEFFAAGQFRASRFASSIATAHAVDVRINVLGCASCDLPVLVREPISSFTCFDKRVESLIRYFLIPAQKLV